MLTTRINPTITRVLCACIVLLASGALWVPVSVANPPVEYTVTSSAGANGAISPDGDTVVAKGGDLSFTATPNTGYKVDTWSVDGAEAQTGGTGFTLTDIQADQTVDVTFKPLGFDISSSADTNGSISPDGTTTVTYGSDLSFTATPNTGYEVDKWSVDGSEAQTGGDSLSLTNIQANHTVDVTFKLLKFEISSSAGENGTVSPDGTTTVTYGSDLGFSATPATGYEVDTWSVDGSEAQTGGDSFTLADIQADQSVDVTFKPLEFDISSSAGSNGAIYPDGSKTVTYGDDQDFTAYPSMGYEVDKWSVDGSEAQTGGDSFSLTDIQADHSVDVTFRLLEFDISGTAGSNGAISPDGDTTVTWGSDLEFTAAPEGEYLVRIWSVDGEQVQIGGDTYMLTGISADHSVDVSFSLLYYVVSSSSIGGGSIDPDGSLTAEPGDSLAYSAQPDPEYRIIKWSVDGSTAQWGGAVFTLDNIQDDHDVTVLFGQVDYAITATAGPGGSVSPKNVGVTSGGNYTFTATPDTGYEVDTWFMDGGVAQTGGTTYEVRGPIYEDHAIHVTFKKKPCESLGTYEFEAKGEFEDGIITNNPPEPNEPLVIVKPVGLGDNPDNKVMAMSNLARAKGAFAKTSADEIQICFKYLFTDPNVELAVSISDSPALLAPDDPLWAQHYIEVGRFAPPPADQAGSPGSDRFAVFQKMVWTDNLNFADGLYVELELTEPNANGQPLADAAVYIDSWSASLQCSGVCLDINGDNAVNGADLLKVVGAYGSAATGATACLEGAFTADGHVDSYDVVAWDWAMNSDQRLLSYCGLPLTGESGGVSLMSAGAPVALAANAPSDLSDILIAGRTAELKDSLCVFDSAGRAGGSSASSRGSIRLAQGPDGGIYQLNSETGLVRLDGTGEVVVPSGKLDIAGEPRYNSSATVYVGIQSGGPDSFGRPVLDVALDAEYVYVVPVVVSPDGGEAYTAAAKLRLSAGSPPYELVELYDVAPLPNDNQYRDNLREIEIDSAGNVYVLNVHSLNESDILWRYGVDGTVERLDLGRPDGGSYVPAPIAMCVSQTTGILYLASAAGNLADPDSTVIYGFSTQGGLAPAGSVTINGLQHVTGITEDPGTGTLWIAGFNMYDIPQDPNPAEPAFCYPCLASISAADDNVEVIPLFDPASHDLALPMSILWTDIVERTGVE